MTNTKETTLDLSCLYPKMLIVPSERYEKFYHERYEVQKNIKTFAVMVTSFRLIPTSA